MKVIERRPGLRLVERAGLVKSPSCQAGMERWQIYVVDVEGGSVQKLTQSAGSSGLPTWSPDGSRLAFVADRDGSWGVYVMPSSGGPQAKLLIGVDNATTGR